MTATPREVADSNRRPRLPYFSESVDRKLVDVACNGHSIRPALLSAVSVGGENSCVHT